MSACHGQTDLGLRSLAIDDEIGDAFLGADDLGAVVVIFAEAKKDASVGGDVKAFFNDNLALGELGEGVEALHEVFLVAIDIEMVGVNGVDDADLRVQVKEGAVEFVGFHDHDTVRTFAEQQIAVEIVGNASYEGGGVDASMAQDICSHCRCGGLTMGACNGNGEMVFRDVPQRFGAFQDGNVALT